MPLVLLHAHPFHRQMWHAQMEVFRTSYRVIAPDLRGYGELTIVPGKVTMEEMAVDIVRLLDELGINMAVICGISMGGHAYLIG